MRVSAVFWISLGFLHTFQGAYLHAQQEGMMATRTDNGAGQTLAYDEATREQATVINVVFCKNEDDEVVLTVFDKRVGSHLMLIGYEVHGAEGETRGKFDKKTEPCAAEVEGRARASTMPKKAKPHQLPTGTEFWWLKLKMKGDVQTPGIPVDVSRMPYRVPIFYRLDDGFKIGEEMLPTSGE